MARDMTEYMSKRRESRRQKLIEMSGGACVVCGSQENLEFNHIDRSKKSFGLSKRGMDYKWETIVSEWEKCELLCKEHHLDRTREQWSEGEMPEIHNSMKHIPYKHGTMRMYQEKSCRCDDCKKAKSVYRQGGSVYSEVFV